MDRNVNRQKALNMASSIAVFVLNLCVSFFLTPYIVEKLGTSAYGFVGLSNNIINYSTLLTVAVNSMGGRFVTVSAHRHDIKEANIYMSSVFFANLTIAILILCIFIIVTLFLPELIRSPSSLVLDVQTLFFL